MFAGLKNELTRKVFFDEVDLSIEVDDDGHKHAYEMEPHKPRQDEGFEMANLTAYMNRVGLT